MPTYGTVFVPEEYRKRTRTRIAYIEGYLAGQHNEAIKQHEKVNEGESDEKETYKNPEIKKIRKRLYTIYSDMRGLFEISAPSGVMGDLGTIFLKYYRDLVALWNEEDK